MFQQINSKYVYALRKDLSLHMSSQMVKLSLSLAEFIGEIDCLSCCNPYVIVHEPKYKVDGITKIIDNSEFTFDNTFSHDESNEELYFYSIRPILDNVFNTGIVTVFAYGQTGSGKTFTM